jgi:hypothetical protein
VLSVRQVIAWGDPSNFKTAVPADLTNAIAVAAGNLYDCVALRADGTPQPWGYPGTNTPVGISNLIEVAVGNGNNRFFGLRTDGVPVTWGFATTATSNELAGMSNIVSIEADEGGSTYLHPDGTITRLDTGGLVVNLSSITNVVALSRLCGDSGFAAVRADGTFYSSGYPNSGITNVMSVGASFYEGVALKRDGTIQSWGAVTNRATSNILAVTATHSGFNFAVQADGFVTNWGQYQSYTPAVTNVPSFIFKPWTLDGGYDNCVALFTTNDFPPIPLSIALNTSNIVVSSRSSPQWFGQTRITHDGKHAARSADLGSNTASSMRMLTNGPCKVTFWWKVSSETDHDFLTFSIGGVPQAAISGEVDWRPVTFDVPPGQQMLVWSYSKDATGTAGMDAAFVDELSFVPVPPTILAQPTDQTVVGPNAAVLSVVATGSRPLTFRWYSTENPTSLSSSALYQIYPTYRSNSGTYYVVVTNSVGTVTSSNVVLTVRVPQRIAYPLLQPDGTFSLTAQDFDGSSFVTNIDLANFQAQYSSNLIDWLPISASLSVTNGVMQFNDVDATNNPMRFYRILENY